MPFTATNEWGKQAYFFVFVFLEDRLHDLFLAELHHLLPRIITISFSNAGIEETKKIIDLCNRSNRASRIFVGGLLFNGNYGRQPCYLVNIGSFHITNEL